MYLIVCPTSSSFWACPSQKSLRASGQAFRFKSSKNTLTLHFFRAFHCNPSRKSAAKLQLIMVHQHFFIYFIRQNPL
jgi:hypothetical protein